MNMKPFHKWLSDIGVSLKALFRGRKINSASVPLNEWAGLGSASGIELIYSFLFFKSPERMLSDSKRIVKNDRNLGFIQS